MLRNIAIAGLFVSVGLSFMPVASAVCTPAAFPSKPVPGGVIGQGWDAAKAAYDGNLADTCTPDVDPNEVAGLAVGLANFGCNFLAGADCAGGPCTAPLGRGTLVLGACVVYEFR